ncbi:hypothetical protein PENTCL1PPCAC_28030 [Pristionchus entomophagus]|uniref:Uncharacterized protein n=1 Tax=Pristionchus entomophagus TaxID=358040 RepID=A0AAV5UHE0_9BILA|nr:hypothetical protein PENTCL1PPCAC_28030 [Pristionchus entomophagus]
MRLLCLLALTILALSEAFCPLTKHQICNPGTKHACTCALIQADEVGSAPERSCNRIAQPEENNDFPALSITFNLGEDQEDDEDWPQKEIADGIATTLRIPKDTVILLRANCFEEADDDDADKDPEEKLVVQFAVLKKNANSTLPYDDADFVDAENLATRLKVMLKASNVNQLGGLEVAKIEYVDELIPIELEPSNMDLIFQAIFMTLLFGAMLVLGCFCLCRKSGEDYEDDLQKHPV